MDKGLLWYDDDTGRDLAERVARAERHYQQKYGRRPNVCYVHPAVVGGKPLRVGAVQVSPLSSVLVHHFWIGEEERERRR